MQNREQNFVSSLALVQVFFRVAYIVHFRCVACCVLFACRGSISIIRGNKNQHDSEHRKYSNQKDFFSAGSIFL